MIWSGCCLTPRRTVGFLHLHLLLASSCRRPHTPPHAPRCSAQDSHTRHAARLLAKVHSHTGISCFTPSPPPKEESSQMWNVPSQFAYQRLSCVSLKIVRLRLIARKEEAPTSQLKTLCCFCAKGLAQHFVKCTYWLSCLAGLDKEISHFAYPRKIHPRMTSSKPTTLQPFYLFACFVPNCLYVFKSFKTKFPDVKYAYFRSLAKHSERLWGEKKNSICDVLFWEVLFFFLSLVSIFRCFLPSPSSFLVIIHLPSFFVCPLGVTASVCSFPYSLPPPNLPPLLS